MKLLIDTWGWITYSNRREERHVEIRTFYNDFRLKKGILYTTDYILDETITLLFRKLPFETAEEETKEIITAIDNNYLILEWINEERFRKARDLRLKFRDKPRISFTDLTSMVVMEEVGIQDVLTEDDHFVHVGMGFKKLP